MPLALLIGFEYHINHLPGAIIDLYHAYSWCQTFTSNIFVLTDISSNKRTEELNRIVTRKIADVSLVTFYDMIPHKLLVNNLRSLQENVKRVLNNLTDNKLIIYYSGHGVKDSLILPDQTLLSFIIFRDLILDLLQPYVEIFWIMDCCNPNGLHLPYKLQNNSFVLSSSKIECVSQPIILITSADSHEKSAATRSGSIFSHQLFLYLQKMNESPTIVIKNNKVLIPTQFNRNLTRLTNNLATLIRKLDTGYVQTVSIYSSYLMDPILWLWIGSIRSSDVVLDMSLSTFDYSKY